MFPKQQRHIWIALFFLSGFVALVYQIVWSKRLGLILGVDILAVSLVLLCFMLGLAFGASWGGRAAQKFAAARLYAAIELGIAGFALLSLWLFELLLGLYPSFYQAFDGPTPTREFGRIIFALVPLAAPTFLMGASFPVMGKILAGQGQVGRNTAIFYSMNTLGAAFGALTTGFLLIPSLGLNNCIYLGAAAQFGIAVLSWRLAKNTADRETPNASRSDSDNAPSTTETRRLDLAVFLSGFTALAYEVILTRNLTMRLGSSTYAFSLVLFLFLAGIAFGAIFFPRLWDKTEKARDAFGFCQIGIALCALVGPILYTQFTGESSFSAASNYRFPEVESHAAFLAYSLGLAALAVLPLALCFGISMPAALRAGLSEGALSTKRYGQLYWWNTMGSALGAIAASFLLVPLLGSNLSLSVLAGFNLISALLVSHRMLRGNAKQVFYLGNLGVAAIAVLFAMPSTSKSGLLFWKEGASTTVAVEEQILNMAGQTNRAIRIGGRVEASTDFLDQRLQKLQGHIPMLLHPGPKKALVIGMGTGMTVGAVAIHPQLEHVELVELSPEVVEASQFFAKQNQLSSPQGKKLSVHIEDARNFLLGTKQHYDVITADPIQPWKAGAGNLYTVEYFSLAKQRLSQDGRGILAQWIPLYQMSSADVKSILASLIEVFPHQQLWLTGYDLVLLGSQNPIQFDETVLKSRMALDPVKSDLAGIAIYSTEGLFSIFLGADQFVANLAQGGAINRDLYPSLEYSAPLSMWKGYPLDFFEQILELPSGPTPFSSSREFQERSQALQMRMKLAVAAFARAPRKSLRSNELATEQYQKELQEQ